MGPGRGAGRAKAIKWGAMPCWQGGHGGRGAAGAPGRREQGAGQGGGSALFQSPLGTVRVGVRGAVRVRGRAPLEEAWGGVGRGWWPESSPTGRAPLLSKGQTHTAPAWHHLLPLPLVY